MEWEHSQENNSKQRNADNYGILQIRKIVSRKIEHTD